MVKVKELIKNQRLYFEGGITKGLDFRLEKLQALRKAIIDSEEEIIEALRKDLGKAPFEAYATEIGIVLEEIKYTIKNLPKWAKRKKVKTPIAQFLSSSYIYSEPYGEALIISPWNYPFQLAILPLVGSIAAGNCTIIKPSEHSPNTSEVIYKIIIKNFDERYISVIKGDVETSQALLEEEFDYIFFTGNIQVGKIVMEAASKYLTPVTLELGGKSPCIVDETADINIAAKRIVWGKFLNAGQTCVAPDYLMVHSSIKDELISKIQEYIIEFYGEDPCSNPDYPKIINEKHFRRLIKLMEGEEIIFGGQANENTNCIAPAILSNVTWSSSIMQEEIFGPLVPILEFEDLNEIVSTVNKRPKSLAVYFFSNNKKRQRDIIGRIPFGGGCINDTITHLASPYMPFGGVGSSGMGSYHGKASFDLFSHKKSILIKSNLFDIPLRYPPFKNNLKLLKQIMK